MDEDYLAILAYEFRGEDSVRLEDTREENNMYCPKCGNLLILKHFENGREELYCVQGDMPLSPAMQQRFEELYGANPMPQSSDPSINKQLYRGLHWFCPGDGESLNAQLECPRCGKHLRDLVPRLIELHPHNK